MATERIQLSSFEEGPQSEVKIKGIREWAERQKKIVEENEAKVDPAWYSRLKSSFFEFLDHQK